MALLIVVLVLTPVWALLGLYLIDRRTARSADYGLRQEL